MSRDVSRLGRVPARDLGPLRQEGYAIAYAEGFDMFPQTPHLQAVVLLER